MRVLYSVGSATVGSRQLSRSEPAVCTRDRGEGLETLCRLLPAFEFARPRIEVLRWSFSFTAGLDIRPWRPARVEGAERHTSQCQHRNLCEYGSLPPPLDCAPPRGFVLPALREADRGPRGVDIVSTTLEDRPFDVRAHSVYRYAWSFL